MNKEKLIKIPKIKRDVDLKELEKYGFRKWDKENCGKSYSYIYDCNGKTPIKIVINKKRVIRILSFNSEIFNLIYDLIKDGLVEKVEE